MRKEKECGIPGITKLNFQILRRTFSTLAQQHGTVKGHATADAPLFGLGERRPAVKHFVAENCSGGCLSLAEVTGDPEVGSKTENISLVERATPLLDWSVRLVVSGGFVTTIGFYEARTHLSELLDQVAKGKKVLITRRGRPAALMGPPPKEEEQNVSQVVKEMLAFRDEEGPTLGRKVTIRQLIEEGRRF